MPEAFGDFCVIIASGATFIGVIWLIYSLDKNIRLNAQKLILNSQIIYPSI